MKSFDPTRDIEGSAVILDSGGEWPSFHDALVYTLKFWQGDMRPDDNVWVGPVIEASIELAAIESPFVVDFRFHDCDYINKSGFSYENMIYEMSFSFEERGFSADGVTPLPPFICVEFENGYGPSLLSFKCFRAEVVNRRPAPNPPCF